MTNDWLISGVITVALIIIGFLTKSWFNSIADKLESIVNVLSEIKIQMKGQDKDISFIKDEIKSMNHRLNDHSKRISEIERKH